MTTTMRVCPDGVLVTSTEADVTGGTEATNIKIECSYPIRIISTAPEPSKLLFVEKKRRRKRGGCDYDFKGIRR